MLPSFNKLASSLEEKMGDFVRPFSTFAIICFVNLMLIDDVDGAYNSTGGRYLSGGRYATNWNDCCENLRLGNTRKTYTLYTDAYANHWEAHRRCQDRGKLLATVISASDQSNMDSVAKSSRGQWRSEDRDRWEFWIDGVLTTQRGWTWNDRYKITYFNWVDGEPNNAGGYERCLQIYRSPIQDYGDYNYKWNDLPCYRRQYYMCMDNPCYPITCVN